MSNWGKFTLVETTKNTDEEFLLELPFSYRFKGQKMLCHVSAHSEMFVWTTNGELIHENNVIKNARLHSLIRFFIKKNTSTDKAPPGAKQFASLLLNSRVPVTSTGDNFKTMFPCYQRKELKKHMWWQKH